MPEVQDIFNRYGERYRETNKLMPYKLKVMNAIEKCRTEQLGYHKGVCLHLVCEFF